MSGPDINSLGLLLDVVGALLIWHFVAQVNLIDEARYLKGSARLTVSDPTPEQIRSYKLRVFTSRAGILLLVVGFSLQLASNHVP